MTKKLLILCAIFFIFLTYAVHANDVMTVNINCNEQIITVSGNIPNTNKAKEVSILVGSIDDILYIDQQSTTDTGDFSFTFSMPDNCPLGIYDIIIGTNADIPIYYGKIHYNKIRSNFITADLDLNIKLYVPTLTGTISCTTGKTVCFNILNITDNTIICNEMITSETGASDISQTLPSLASNKEYQLTISCYENNETISQISAVIDSSILAVDITGDITLADDIQVDVDVQSSNFSSINMSKTFSSSRSVSGTIPNLVPFASIEIMANGYEMVPVDIEDTWTVHTISGTPSNEFKIITTANNISDFNNKTFTLKYNENQVEPISFFGMQHEDLIGAGKVGNINIISYSQGEVEFSVEDITIPDSKVWNGITNVFKFKFKPDYSGSTEIKIR